MFGAGGRPFPEREGKGGGGRQVCFGDVAGEEQQLRLLCCCMDMGTQTRGRVGLWEEGRTRHYYHPTNSPPKSPTLLLTPSSENYPWAFWTRQQNPAECLSVGGRAAKSVSQRGRPSPSVPFGKERRGRKMMGRKAALKSVCSCQSGGSLVSSVCLHLMNLNEQCFES